MAGDVPDLDEVAFQIQMIRIECWCFVDSSNAVHVFLTIHTIIHVYTIPIHGLNYEITVIMK